MLHVANKSEQKYAVYTTYYKEYIHLCDADYYTQNITSSFDVRLSTVD